MSGSARPAETSAPGHLAAADREADLLACFRRLQTGAGREGGPVEDEIAVVVREAEHGPVAPREAPGAAQRGRALRDVGREGGRDLAHGRPFRG